MVIHEGETLSEVKVRIQKKLQVVDEEFSKVFLLCSCSKAIATIHLFFILKYICQAIDCNHSLFYNMCDTTCFLSSQWKFAFLSLGRPEYLQDSDVVSNRFQVSI